METTTPPKLSRERRRTADRRRRPTHPFLPLRAPKRRAAFRRRGEKLHRYVDRLEARVVTWAVVVLLMCALDAVLTLFHIERGGEEWMPTMRWALSLSVEAFTGIKMGITAVGAVFLAAHQNFPVARFCIRFVFFVYFFLMAYHVILTALSL